MYEENGFSSFLCQVEEVIKKSNEKLDRIKKLREKEDEETVEGLVDKYNRFYYRIIYWFVNLFLREKYVCDKKAIKNYLDREIALGTPAAHCSDLWFYPSFVCEHQEEMIIKVKNAAMEASIMGQKEMMITANDWALIS